MLDLRIYRAAFVPVLFAVLVVAFSLQDRPRPLETTLAPDAFDGARASALLQGLAGAFPDRRPGSPGDDALARRVEQDLRAIVPGRQVGDEPLVRVQRVRAQTIDGERRITNVIATRPGAPGPGIVVVAHRDAAGRGARAELSGTAALLELARVAGDGRLRRTITFVSTSGGTGGAGGAAAAVSRLPRPVDAVLVLGNLAGARVHKPFVVGFSNGHGMAPLRLRRTVETAVRAEAGVDPGAPRAALQWARQAAPLTIGEQGAFGRAGLPAVLLSASGERPPPAGAAVSDRRLGVFGRAALRTVTALDAGPDVAPGPQSLIVTRRKVLPGWAIRLLVAALMLPVLLAAIDGFARVRRRREDVGRWLRWTLVTALPFAVVAAVARVLAMAGLLDPAPPAPVQAGSVPVDGAAVAALAVLALTFALAWLGLRPVGLRTFGARGRPEGAGPAAALAVLVCGLVVVAWVVNPFAAALLVPAAHVWLLATAPEVRLPRPVAAGAVLLALAVPLLAVAALDAQSLGLSAGQAAWMAVLLVAGGHVAAWAWLGASLLAGCAVAAVMIVLRAPPGPEAGPGDVTVRGPVTYAGPGSLGGTESALRP
jgi:hypothetical protein